MSNRDNKDKELSKLLKQQAWGAEPNEWFTHRVMHKLPAKRNKSALHFAWFCYIAAVVVCIGFWVWMLTVNDNSVITVRHIIYFVIALAVTIMLAISPIVAMFRRA